MLPSLYSDVYCFCRRKSIFLNICDVRMILIYIYVNQGDHGLKQGSILSKCLILRVEYCLIFDDLIYLVSVGYNPWGLLGQADVASGPLSARTCQRI